MKGPPHAGGIEVDGSFSLHESRFANEIEMFGARIKGDLHFHGSKLEVNQGDALSADGINVGGKVQLHMGFTSNGMIRLRGAKIEGGLDCSGAKLEVKEGEAISAHRAEIRGGVFLNEGFSSNGLVGLLYARIGSVVACSNARLEVKEGDALSLDGAEVFGTVHLTPGFASTGMIRMRGASIRGTLDCSGAKLDVVEGASLSAEQAEIGGNVLLRDGFESSGLVSFVNAQIKGELDCRGAKLLVKIGDALNIFGATIGSSVDFRDGFEASGTVRMPSVRISGDLDCSGAKLLDTGYADGLVAHNARIGRNVSLVGFHSARPIRLHGAQIDGDLTFLGAEVARVVCSNLSLSGDLVWLGIRKTLQPILDLSGAKIRTLDDDRASWPSQDNLFLDGLAYNELFLRGAPSVPVIENRWRPKPSPTEVSQRIDWIMLQSSDRRIEPQPWMQFRDLLEKRGDKRGAKHVLYKFRCVQSEGSNFVIRRLKIAFAWLEEAPQRIGLSIGFTFLLFTAIFWHAGAGGALAPTERDAYEAFIAGKPMPAAYPVFNPVIYTLEDAVPLVKLGEDDKWAPDRRHVPIGHFTGYWFLMWARWLLILSGWFQATVLGAALSRRFKE
jgi:hypothetical protein